MNKVKILHCADLHIGACESFLGARAKSRQAETLHTFEKAVSLAQKENVDIFLIAGDLFDSFDIEYSVIKDVLSSISLAPQIKFVYAAGNHDPYSVNSPLRKEIIPDNMYILGTEDSVIAFNELKTRVYGRSFKEVYDKGEEKFGITPPDDDFVNIMCIHGELSSDKNSDYNPITPYFVKVSGMDYIALGHTHKNMPIAELGKTHFAYCGCIEGQGFDESGEKGVYLGDVSKNGTALKFIPLAQRMHLIEEINVADGLSSAEISETVLNVLQEKYGDSYAENLYKITITGDCSEDYTVNCDDVAARLNEILYFAKVNDKTTVALNLNVMAREPSLKGIFVKKMLEKAESASQEEKELINEALNLGLKAFNSEVTYRENK